MSSPPLREGEGEGEEVPARDWRNLLREACRFDMPDYIELPDGRRHWT